VPEPALTIADLVQEIQTEAAALRKAHGISAILPTQPQVEALAALPQTNRSAQSDGTNRAGIPSLLYKTVHPGEGELRSHRGQIGRLVIFVKKALRQLLRPVLDRQASFNQALIQSLEAQNQRLRDHEQQIQALRRTAELGATIPSSLDFNYAAFEERYRGSPEHVREIQTRYRDYFCKPEDGPVLDLGCGRGEFLELLQEKAVPCFGVDLAEEAVAQAQSHGLQVERRDLLEALEACAADSLGGIVSFQVIEHLPLWMITKILRLAKEKLRPGGILILETVNVASLYTHANAFTMDPTHALALHPLALQLMVEDAQFGSAQISYSGEVPAEDRMQTIGVSPELAENFHRLNTLLFSPQDYAIIAKA